MKKSIKVLMMTIMLILLLVPAFPTSMVEAATSPSYDNAVNGIIANKALCSVGGYGGQCKAWVQQLVWNVSGIYVFSYCSADSWWPKRWLPSNLPSGSGWYSASFANVIASGTRGLSGAWWLLKPGNVVQFTHSAITGRITPHTIIIQQTSSSGFWVVDANWASDGKIQRHFIDKIWLDRYSLAWTAYQIR